MLIKLISSKVLIGNPIRFQMVQGGTGNNLKTGRLMVVDGQELDYETENFYLFSITVTVSLFFH